MTEERKKKLNKKAVAIDYDPDGAGVPRVVARGAGEIAEKIIEAARKSNVPLYEDEDLVKVLYKLEIGSEIPPELYRAVAEVLAFVWKANGMLPSGRRV